MDEKFKTMWIELKEAKLSCRLNRVFLHYPSTKELLQMADLETIDWRTLYTLKKFYQFACENYMSNNTIPQLLLAFVVSEQCGFYWNELKYTWTKYE